MGISKIASKAAKNLVRSRTLKGTFRKINGAKLLKTIRSQYKLSAEALAHHSGNMKLGTLRKIRGVTSQNGVLKGLFGLKGGRHVTNAGTIHAKRADTLLGTLRKNYKLSKGAFSGHSDAMKLGSLRKMHGVSSIADLLKGVFGLKGGRNITSSGRIHAKRGDTLVRTIEKQYGVDFGVRGDMHLSTLRKRLGETSIGKLLQAIR